MYIYNTLTRKKEKFKPLKGRGVKLYSCGPTVYNYAHIGNLRTYILVDTLKRTLTANKYKVRHVMNITDVGHLTSDADEGEDKLEKGAKREKKSVWDVAEFYTQAFKNDITLLNIQPPNTWSRATDHIKEQIALIKALESKGFTYGSDEAVYFDTGKDKDYGKLTGTKHKTLQAGAGTKSTRRKKGITIDTKKKNPTDFVLWFKRVGKYKNHTMHWNSPWGNGFPGWHVECSAMSMKYLGETLDIHTGGIDHIGTHHTNEIAQSENATGKKFVRHWVHGEFLHIGDELKMAKSGNNFLTLQTLINKHFHPLSFRYLVLNTHYRSKLQFTWHSLSAAQNALRKIHQASSTTHLSQQKGGNTTPYEQKFLKALNDDLNTPQALAVVWEVIKGDLPEATKRNLLKSFDEALGLGLDTVKPVKITRELTNLLNERELSRTNKQFVQADTLRKKIEALGYEVEDTPQGPCLNPPLKSLLKT